MPRKSILKAPPISSNDNTENSQPGAVPDDVTQSMDFTEVQPSQPRKSFGRRVSFASHAHVRLFEVRDQNANGTADPSSSPDRPPSADNSSNNENTHAQPDEAPRPRRSSISRRRSSVAFSEFGEQSMDMDMDDTAPSLEHFIRDGQYDGTVEEDEEFSDEYDDGEDMDMTEAVPHNLVHRRSLSLPRQPFLPQRRRSSTTPVLTSSQSQRENQPPPPIEQSYTDDTQTSQLDEDMTTSSVQSQSFASEGSSGEHTQPMEFTIPINRSLRPPAEQDNAWQQLRAATHAGVTPTDPQPEVSVEADAELTDALNRMLKARDSIGLPPHNGPLVTRSEGSEGDVSLEDRPLEDSFTSTDDSFSRELDPDGIDEQTMNITTMIRSSLGSTAMDETSVYGGQFPDHEPTELMEPQPQEMEKPPSLRANIFSAPATEQPSRPSVFTLPGQTSKPNVLSAEQQIFSTPEPPPSKASAQPNRSPSKPPASVTVPKPFTFSFRPPVRINAPATPTTPSKVPIFRGTAAFAPPSAPKSPKKRTAPEDTDPHEDGPSAAKKQAIGKLSPAKKSGSEARPGPSTTTTARRTSAVRRPSGYFAQRKSLGGGANTGNPSPRKPTAHGRQSLGSTTPHDDQVSLYPDPSEVAKEVSEPPARIRSPISVMSSPATPANNAHCERETFRQSIVVPSPTRGSPAPAVRVASPVPAIRPTASSLPPPVADSAGITSAEKTAPQSPPPESLSVRTANERRKSHIIPHSQNVFEEQNKHPADDTEPTATQQWRDGVQEEGLEDEGVRMSHEI